MSKSHEIKEMPLHDHLISQGCYELPVMWYRESWRFLAKLLINNLFLFFSNLIILSLQIVMVHNIKTGKPRGYAFIEYEHERDMHCEYPTIHGVQPCTRKIYEY